MFKFGFGKLAEEETDESKSNDICWHDAQQINPDKKIIDELKYDTKLFNCNGIKLQYVSSIDVQKLKESGDSNCIVRAETEHSDLITAEYEGGLKIWECTSDLISYLINENVDFFNKKVLDLGCGAGLIGIYTLAKGSLADFQDYNKEVIEYTTIPNVALNCNDKLDSCKFYSGDWKSFRNVTNTKYDFILTSETIYNPNNYQKMCDIFEHLLEENGVIYLAAKTYYFGVGGSIRQFEQLINQKGFTSNVEWSNSEGVQREILKISKR